MIWERKQTIPVWRACEQWLIPRKRRQAADFTDKAARGSVKVTRKNDSGKPVDQKVGHEQYSVFVVKPGDVVFVGRRVF